jgi:hypothetical protein
VVFGCSLTCDLSIYNARGVEVVRALGHTGVMAGGLVYASCGLDGASSQVWELLRVVEVVVSCWSAAVVVASVVVVIVGYACDNVDWRGCSLSPYGINSSCNWRRSGSYLLITLKG